MPRRAAVFAEGAAGHSGPAVIAYKLGRLTEDFKVRTALLPMVAMVSPLSAQSNNGARSDDIVVTAAPPVQQQLIDRRVYLVKNNAEAQTESGLDILRHVPSVTVNAKEQVQLLGDPSVKVMIDGHPVNGGANAIKALPAARIAKVEVMTNPSAAYSAEGTGGIINIVTRHDAAAGLAGSATAAVGSLGSTDMQIAPSYAQGRWSAALTLGLRDDINDYVGLRQRAATDPDLDFVQSRRDTLNVDYFSGRLDLAFSPRSSTKWTLSVTGDDLTARFGDRLESLSRGSDEIPAQEDNPSSERRRHYAGTLNYSWTGKRRGESLAVSGNYDSVSYDRPGSIIDRYDRGTDVSDVVHSGTTETAELKIDYSHPMRRADILAIGGAVTHVRDSETNGLIISSASSAISSFPSTPATGDWTTVAGYGTLQFPIRGWKLLPGIRVEERIQDTGLILARARREELLWFPSFHVDRKLTKRLELAASYSRRVLWPTITQLNPTIRYLDILSGESGNPQLRPQRTNTIETSLRFTPGRQVVSLKLYDRETADTFGFAAQTLPGGSSVTAPVNDGHSSKRGGEISASGPILKRLRYSASANFGVRRTEVVAGVALTNFDQFAYSGNVLLEYQGKSDGKPGANRVALEAQYGGPTRQYQQRTGSWVDSSLRWTHTYTTRLSSVLKISDLVRGQRDVTELLGADYVQTERSRPTQQRIMFSIVSRLGRAN